MRDLLNSRKGENCLLICTGKTIAKYDKKLPYYWDTDNNMFTFGMNSASSAMALNYHLFTNNDRIKNYNSNYCEDLLIGSHIKTENRPIRDYTLINYTDRDVNEPIGYENGIIKGYYRTSGCLAIMIAHLMGAKKIYIAGMDGFTYNFDGNVHFHKDDRNNKNNVKSKKEWLERYDKPVMKVLDNLKEYGCEFKIITPTLFEKHYDGSML